MLLGLAQPPLVGLAVHGHELLAELAEHADGRGAAADVGPGAPLGGDGAHQHQAVRDVASRLGGARSGRVGPSTSTMPSTTALRAPARTSAASARAPSSRPSPETTMVLPAPVSPVTTFRPGLSSSTASSMTPRFWIRISRSTGPA